MAVITAAEVADWIGALETDARIQSVTDAAVKWTEDRRSLTEPTKLWEEADVHLGAIIYAGLLHMQRGQAQGLSGTDELGVYSEDVGMAMAQVYRLIGKDPGFC